MSEVPKPHIDLIVLQQPSPEGVWTTFKSGRRELLPYRVDNEGNEYVEMWPNDELIAESN